MDAFTQFNLNGKTFLVETDLVHDFFGPASVPPPPVPFGGYIEDDEDDAAPVDEEGPYYGNQEGDPALDFHEAETETEYETESESEPESPCVLANQRRTARIHIRWTHCTCERCEK